MTSATQAGGADFLLPGNKAGTVSPQRGAGPGASWAARWEAGLGWAPPDRGAPGIRSTAPARPPAAAFCPLEFKTHGPVLEGQGPPERAPGTPRPKGAQVWGPGGGGGDPGASEEPGGPRRQMRVFLSSPWPWEPPGKRGGSCDPPPATALRPITRGRKALPSNKAVKISETRP